ncbi:Heterogeneous nuclear ribonucleoprotein 27C [Halotydeus destructor]|nr:Heterogeneous nuclear ribonucleoprotein 27C [Halotydeus destructor]
MTLDTGEEAGKLFVGGLSWETTAEKLTEYFSRYGEIGECTVMKNAETGRSRGFGFVTFKDASCVHLILSSGPHQLDERTIDPKSCNAKSAQKVKKEAKMSNFPKVFLGGLPPDVNETVLREYFSKYGKVIEVVIMYDQEKKKIRGNGFRGFGFLSFDNDEAVNNVVSEHYVTINGKKVEVKRAEPREKTAPVVPGNKEQNAQPSPQPPPQLVTTMAPTEHPSYRPGWWPPPAPHPGHPPPPHGVAPMQPGPYPPPHWAVPATAPHAPYGPGAWTPPMPPAYPGYPWPGYAGYTHPSQGWNPSQPYNYGAAYPTTYAGYAQPGPVPPAPPVNMNGVHPSHPAPPQAGVPAGYGSPNAMGPPHMVGGMPPPPSGPGGLPNYGSPSPIGHPPPPPTVYPGHQRNSAQAGFHPYRRAQ